MNPGPTSSKRVPVSQITRIDGYLYHPVTEVVWAALEAVFGPGQRRCSPLRDRLSLDLGPVTVYAESSAYPEPLAHALNVVLQASRESADLTLRSLEATFEREGILYIMAHHETNADGDPLMEDVELESPDFAKRYRALMASRKSAALKKDVMTLNRIPGQ
jgi:hypothetical protein